MALERIYVANAKQFRSSRRLARSNVDEKEQELEEHLNLGLVRTNGDRLPHKLSRLRSKDKPIAKPFFLQDSFNQPTVTIRKRTLAILAVLEEVPSVLVLGGVVYYALHPQTHTKIFPALFSMKQ